MNTTPTEVRALLGLAAAMRQRETQRRILGRDFRNPTYELGTSKIRSDWCASRIGFRTFNPVRVPR